ncbi:type II secretion system protein [Candidatus Uhrbacteria bacterium]|nr:type II secretion system protein [Candidatus Uhrbacteria bacterium]
MLPPRAFTLVETLVVLAVTAAVLLLITMMSVSTNRRFRTAVAQRDATIVAERALDRIVREIRAAQTGADGSYPIRTASDRELIILSDVDGDRTAEWLRYALVAPTAREGGRLERSVAEPSGTPARYDPATATTTVLARGIRNEARPIFSYFGPDAARDPNSDPLPTPSRLSDTRHIRIELLVNLDPAATATTTVVSAATIRNLIH